MQRKNAAFSGASTVTEVISAWIDQQNVKRRDLAIDDLRGRSASGGAVNPAADIAGRIRSFCRVEMQATRGVSLARC
jgi:hypothetical protein